MNVTGHTPNRSTARGLAAVLCIAALAATASAPRRSLAQAGCEAQGGGNAWIVLDRSGSMGGAKWDAAKSAVRTLFGGIDRPVNWGLILFSSGACGRASGEVAARAGPAREDEILDLLDRTRPGGATAIAGALLLAYDELAESRGENAIILITDGQDGCRPDEVAAARPEGVTVYVVGFGDGIDQDMLSRMAAAGSDDPDAVPYLANNADALAQALLDIGGVLPNAGEMCNGLDDDCDLRVDEGALPEVGDACQTLEPGICRAGHTVCSEGQLACVAVSPPTGEVCNGVDDDCDGSTDEVHGGELCATGLPGPCAEGRTVCIGRWTCQQIRVPSDEICDGIDDDCDGRVDEGVRRGCGTCEGPGPDRCDGADNDCDGAIDEDARCDEGRVCHSGACRAQCPFGECATGSCDGRTGRCLTACEIEGCPPGTHCDIDHGRCVDPCDETRCASGLVCRDGRCVTRQEAACGADPCEPNPCGTGEVCHSECDRATCRPSCADISCPLFSACRQGYCADDPCGGITCDESLACRDGRCEPDPCSGVWCSAGMACIEGFCQHGPCVGVRCPLGQVCRMQGGHPRCMFADFADDEDSPGADAGSEDLFPPGSEAPPTTWADGDAEPRDGVDHGLPISPREAEIVGCACNAGGEAPGWPLVLLLAGFMARWRRRAGHRRVSVGRRV